jgi:hypothetical protein
MINKRKLLPIFPKELNNNYEGNNISKYGFLLITVVTIIRSLIHTFAPDGGAQTIATIPLNSYTQAGASAVIFVFSLWGLSQLLMGIVYAIVYWRYKALIPFMYILIISEYSMRIVIGRIKPIAVTGMAPGAIGNYIMVPIGIILFILSITKRLENS